MMFRLPLAVITIVAAAGSLLYAGQHAVSQKARLFSPGAITINVGDTVIFKNDDSVTHHVYSATRGQEFELETAEPGDDARQTFTKRGRAEIRCGLHPGMRMIVNIK
jgi:plastocyanin